MSAETINRTSISTPDLLGKNYPVYRIGDSIPVSPQHILLESVHHAKNAGSQALRIQEDGITQINEIEKVGGKFTEAKAITRTNVFVSLSAVSGKSENRNVASVSTGLYWEADFEKQILVQVIGRGIAGWDTEIRKFGEDKLLLLIETDYSPREMLERLVNVPRVIIDKSSDEVRNVLNKLQDVRGRELLEGSLGKQFIGITEGVADPSIRAFQKNNKHAFVYGWRREKDNLWGINPDDKEQEMRKIAFDEETCDMQEEKHRFLTGETKRYRYAVEVVADKYVKTCCGASFNAQFEVQGEDFQRSVLGNMNGVHPLVESPIFIPALMGGGGNSSKEYCRECKEEKDSWEKCKCSKEKQAEEK